MHNVPVLVKGKDRCTLLVHPDDAAAARRSPTATLADGRAPRPARVVVPVEVSDEIEPGVVSLPHGWGHDKPGTRLSVAREHAGVNNNVLAPGDLRRRDLGQRRRERHPGDGAPAVRRRRSGVTEAAGRGAARTGRRRGPERAARGKAATSPHQTAWRTAAARPPRRWRRAATSGRPRPPT